MNQHKHTKCDKKKAGHTRTHLLHNVKAFQHINISVLPPSISNNTKKIKIKIIYRTKCETTVVD